MTKSLFRQSFLSDSLDLEQPVLRGALTLDSGVTIKLHGRGLVEVVPARSDAQTKHLIVSCGIHGNETAPMELVDKLLDDLVSGFQPVNEHCLFILAHPEAAQRQARFIEENLNRLFDDRPHPKTQESALAERLKATVADFYAGTKPEQRWHLDLHCAIRGSKHYSFAVSPKTRHPVRSRALMGFIEQAHIEAVMLSNAPSSTFSWFSADYFAAQAMTIELGQVAQWGENDLSRLVAFELALRDLVARERPEHLPKKPVIYRVSRTIVRLHDDFDFRFGEEVENFTAFMHGEVFGHDGDKPLMAKNEGEAIVFPNRYVAIGQRAALMVCKVDTRYEEDQLVYD
ncbi:succinylglutamate desuccinylase [Vibrio sp.]|uniref:succinylglutamate desuccinylase n=1 Tax=Vibrio sp. TaxID=678 RepID=UPI003D0F2F0A